MILIFGGAYQGKLDYALANYEKYRSVFACTDTTLNIDFSKHIIYSLHLLFFAQVKNNIDSLKYIKENLEQLKDKILICDDISSGVVPAEKEERLWREASGRCLTLLSKHSDEVIRVFCGIGMKLK